MLSEVTVYRSVPPLQLFMAPVQAWSYLTTRCCLSNEPALYAIFQCRWDCSCL